MPTRAASSLASKVISGFFATGGALDSQTTESQDPRFADSDRRAVSPPFRLREPCSPKALSFVTVPAEVYSNLKDAQFMSTPAPVDCPQTVPTSPSITDPESVDFPVSHDNPRHADNPTIAPAGDILYVSPSPDPDLVLVGALDADPVAVHGSVREGKFTPVKTRAPSASVGEYPSRTKNKSPVKTRTLAKTRVTSQPTAGPSTERSSKVKRKRRPLDELWAELSEARKHVRELGDMIIEQIGVPGIEIVPDGTSRNPIILG
ncbi:hypothetical protein BC834DRAFT_881020 [Gloeopeniophorella convolvens]|nr:hypothetical protein BC834DRAFT_881020 [Gloeopeniophorella convolvens]